MIRAPLSAVELASRVRAADKPFIPARYAELRTQAVEQLRRMIAAYCKDDQAELARAVVDGDKVVRSIDALWIGR